MEHHERVLKISAHLSVLRPRLHVWSEYFFQKKRTPEPSDIPADQIEKTHRTQVGLDSAPTRPHGETDNLSVGQARIPPGKLRCTGNGAQLSRAEDREAQRNRVDSLSVLFLFICSVFTRFPHHYVILSPSSWSLGCFTLNSLKAFLMHLKAQLKLYVLHLHLLSLGWYCYYLPFLVPKIFRRKHIFFDVFCFYFCVFLPLLWPLAVFLFLKCVGCSSTPGKCQKQCLQETGNTPLIWPANIMMLLGLIWS